MENKQDNMPKIVLRVFSNSNCDGGELVAKFESLPVALMAANGKAPKVMLWGNRVFVWHHEDARGDLVYIEDIAWPIIAGQTAFEVPLETPK